MVGPGEVDDDLEPEVKEECNGKYGDVLSVNVIELPDPPRPEEAVRIFIEFKKVAAAIKGKLRYKKLKHTDPNNLNIIHQSSYYYDSIVIILQP